MIIPAWSGQIFISHSTKTANINYLLTYLLIRLTRIRDIAQKVHKFCNRIVDE